MDFSDGQEQHSEVIATVAAEAVAVQAAAALQQALQIKVNVEVKAGIISIPHAAFPVPAIVCVDCGR